MEKQKVRPNRTTLWISEKTWERIHKHKKLGITTDQLLNKLLDFFDKVNNTHES